MRGTFTLNTLVADEIGSKRGGRRDSGFKLRHGTEKQGGRGTEVKISIFEDESDDRNQFTRMELRR